MSSSRSDQRDEQESISEIQIPNLSRLNQQNKIDSIYKRLFVFSLIIFIIIITIVIMAVGNNFQHRGQISQPSTSQSQPGYGTISTPCNPNIQSTSSSAELTALRTQISIKQSQIQRLKQQNSRISSSTSVTEQQKYISILQNQVNIKNSNQISLRAAIGKNFIPFKQNEHDKREIHSTQLISFYRNKGASSVADFGCGKCGYILDVAKALSIQVTGYDATPFNNDPRIKNMDLSQRTNLGVKYDYVQSFQVGEHIYSDFEDNFIYNIANHAKKGILMSWGIYGQPGYLHVNNRPRDYIIRKVELYGFKYNKQISEKWKGYFPGFAVYDKV